MKRLFIVLLCFYSGLCIVILPKLYQPTGYGFWDYDIPYMAGQVFILGLFVVVLPSYIYKWSSQPNTKNKK